MEIAGSLDDILAQHADEKSGSMSMNKLVQMIKGAIGDNIVRPNIKSLGIIGAVIPGINKQIVHTGKLEQIKNGRWAIEVMFHDGIWACCYLDTLTPVTLPCGALVLKLGDTFKDSKKQLMINLITTKGKVCVLAKTLMHAYMLDKEGLPVKNKPINWIFKAREYGGTKKHYFYGK